MAAPMHFRKRQLLEYQIQANTTPQSNAQQSDVNELNVNLINEPLITFEYPPSPSSMGSEKSTPTKYDNTPPRVNFSDTNEYSTEQMQILAKNTVALLEMENLSPKSTKDAQKLTEIAESLTALENFSHNPNVHFNNYQKGFTYDASTLIHFAYNLKQTIEEYIKHEISNASANKASLSTLILAKLNQLRVNALLKPKKCVEQLPFDRSHCPPNQESELVPEDLSLKRKEHDYQSSYDEPTSEMDYEESNLVIDESYVEILTDDDDNNHEITIVEKSKSKKRYTRQGLQQIATRISGIFSFINRTQTRMEELMRRGINVYEKSTHSSKKSKKKSKKSSKSLSNTQVSKSVPNSNTQLKPFNRLTEISTPAETSVQKYLPSSNGNRPLPIYKPKPWTNGLGDDKKYNKNYPIPCPYDDSRLIIGPNGTTILKTEWAKVDWEQTPPAITRKILMTLFDRDFLATHSLTGRPSPAFLDLNYPEKKPLDTKIVADLVDLVTSRTIATAKEVRMAITTKCADESKMRRCRETRLLKQNENIRIRPY
ncbi:uncharacterized protein LOC129951114 [Eupeodes corollae]|uniref:uncharacterized protein LOC129951114 n=1 Tax=Eupeodes corollae TaxID=290404 RepID=UPI0024905711|nr:uncharacterized protein LOC129951114 [Eupeodes corollae]